MKASALPVKRSIVLVLSIALVVIAESLPQRTHETPLRVAVGLWPGSETLLLARELGMLPESRFTLLEATWSSVTYRAFDSGAVDAAVLTGASVRRLLESGKNIRVVCFMDESRGVDALVAMEDVRNVSDLKGKRVGFAPHGPGIHLLSEALVAAGLKMDDVEEVSLLPAEIPGALLRREVSAVVAAEPWIRQMVGAGAHVLIDSNALKIPGIRMLVVHEKALTEQREKLVNLVNAHFAIAPTLHAPEDDEGIGVVLRRQRLSRSEFAELMSSIRIFDRAENLAFMNEGNDTMSGTLNLMDSSGKLVGIRPAEQGNEWMEESIINEAAP